MPSSIVRRRVPLIADLAIAVALAGTVTFFLIVMEYCVGHGELTRAELQLRDTKLRMAHSPAATGENKTDNGNIKESNHGQWWSSRTAN
jgi:hypothetical protein